MERLEDIRTGFEVTTRFTSRERGVRLTPTQHTLETLASALKEFDLSDSQRRHYVAEAIKIDTLTIMNMDVLAAAFYLISKFGESDEILSPPSIFTTEETNAVVEYLMRNFTPSAGKTKQSVENKYKQELYRYIFKIFTSKDVIEIVEPIATSEEELPVDTDEE